MDDWATGGRALLLAAKPSPVGLIIAIQRVCVGFYLKTRSTLFWFFFKEHIKNVWGIFPRLIMFVRDRKTLGIQWPIWFYLMRICGAIILG
jgi:hypothetical protein